MQSLNEVLKQTLCRYTLYRDGGLVFLFGSVYFIGSAWMEFGLEISLLADIVELAKLPLFHVLNAQPC